MGTIPFESPVPCRAPTVNSGEELHAALVDRFSAGRSLAISCSSLPNKQPPSASQRLPSGTQ